ncbi:hypothetical protein BDA99DRAFT_559446 [Phascolomyces articulosus]|uniref:F-box domain-containing protein n=1 Tax=Phascolomyces articulosus TaxID=60185 RepID=A0AAD5KEH4_9FUNG|nr:hypothetical protein BDA99DRAFT_559446 [Phascolomyces articulosus]
MELNENRIGFVSILPTELSDCIFVELDETSKEFRLTVSKTWRATILACAVTWSNLEMDDNDLNVEERISEEESQAYLSGTYRCFQIPSSE